MVIYMTLTVRFSITFTKDWLPYKVLLMLYFCCRGNVNSVWTFAGALSEAWKNDFGFFHFPRKFWLENPGLKIVSSFKKCLFCECWSEGSKLFVRFLESDQWKWQLTTQHMLFFINHSTANRKNSDYFK